MNTSVSVPKVPSVGGICSIPDAMKAGLSVEECVRRHKRYHYAFKRLHQTYAAGIDQNPREQCPPCLPLLDDALKAAGGLDGTYLDHASRITNHESSAGESQRDLRPSQAQGKGEDRPKASRHHSAKPYQYE